jgi:hypothetical protein
MYVAGKGKVDLFLWKMGRLSCILIKVNLELQLVTKNGMCHNSIKIPFNCVT